MIPRNDTGEESSCRTQPQEERSEEQALVKLWEIRGVLHWIGTSPTRIRSKSLERKRGGHFDKNLNVG